MIRASNNPFSCEPGVINPSLFKGTFITLSALNIAYPTPEAGSTANIFNDSVADDLAVWDSGDAVWRVFSGQGVDISGKQDVLTETNFGVFTYGLTLENVISDDDKISFSDYSDSNKQKKTSFQNLKNKLKSPRTFTCYFGINQNVAATPIGNTQWFRKDAAQGNNVNSSFTLQTSLDVSTTFATHSVLGACHTLPFQANIKSVRIRGWTNTTNSTGVDFVILASKETEPNIASGVTTISNAVIIARETVQIYAAGYPNGFNKEFASGNLNTVTLPKGSDIRSVFKNFNLASNMFDTILTLEFEEVI